MALFRWARTPTPGCLWSEAEECLISGMSVVMMMVLETSVLSLPQLSLIS